MYLLHLLALT